MRPAVLLFFLAAAARGATVPWPAALDGYFRAGPVPRAFSDPALDRLSARFHDVDFFTPYGERAAAAFMEVAAKRGLAPEDLENKPDLVRAVANEAAEREAERLRRVGDAIAKGKLGGVAVEEARDLAYFGVYYLDRPGQDEAIQVYLGARARAGRRALVLAETIAEHDGFWPVAVKGLLPVQREGRVGEVARSLAAIDPVTEQGFNILGRMALRLRSGFKSADDLLDRRAGRRAVERAVADMNVEGERRFEEFLDEKDRRPEGRAALKLFPKAERLFITVGAYLHGASGHLLKAVIADLHAQAQRAPRHRSWFDAWRALAQPRWLRNGTKGVLLAREHEEIAEAFEGIRVLSRRIFRELEIYQGGKRRYSGKLSDKDVDVRVAHGLKLLKYYPTMALNGFKNGANPAVEAREFRERLSPGLTDYQAFVAQDGALSDDERADRREAADLVLSLLEGIELGSAPGVLQVRAERAMELAEMWSRKPAEAPLPALKRSLLKHPLVAGGVIVVAATAIHFFGWGLVFAVALAVGILAYIRLLWKSAPPRP